MAESKEIYIILTAREFLLYQFLADKRDEMSRGCDDLPGGSEEMLTPLEWRDLDKKWHDWNGDQEEHDPNEANPYLGHGCLLVFFETLTIEQCLRWL